MLLAIDPGPEESTFLWWDEESSSVRRFLSLPNTDLLRYLRGDSGVADIRLVAVEMIASYGMPVGKEVFETCLMIGRIVEIMRRYKVVLIERQKVKLHLCGSPRAKDSNVRQALIDRVGPQGRKASPGPTYGISGHTWQALAIAVYAHDTFCQNEVKA